MTPVARSDGNNDGEENQISRSIVGSCEELAVRNLGYEREDEADRGEVDRTPIRRPLAIMSPISSASSLSTNSNDGIFDNGAVLMEMPLTPPLGGGRRRSLVADGRGEH